MKTTRYTSRKCQGCGKVTSQLVTDEHFRAAQLHSAYADKHAKPEGFYITNMGHHVIPCRGCGKALHAKPVRGIFSAKHVCSAKCLSSTGHSCECSCGGKNHGAAHAA